MVEKKIIGTCGSDRQSITHIYTGRARGGGGREEAPTPPDSS